MKKNILKLLVILLLITFSVLLYIKNNPEQEFAEGKISVWFYTNNTDSEIKEMVQSLDSTILIKENMSTFDAIVVKVSIPESKSEDEMVEEFQKYPQVIKAMKITRVKGIGPVRGKRK